jgi:hypothetical protein
MLKKWAESLPVEQRPEETMGNLEKFAASGFLKLDLRRANRTALKVPASVRLEAAKAVKPRKPATSGR